MKNLKSILDDIGIIKSAQKIYISLLQDGDATALLLSRRTGITRPSVYDQIKELKTLGLVAERNIEGKTYFSASDIKQLDNLLAEKMERVETGRKTLDELISTFTKTQTTQPKIRFFEGKDGARQLLKDILWYDEMTLLIFWPYQEMLDMLGEDFLQWFNERRIRRKIKVRTIWPFREIKRSKHVFSDNDAYVTRRYAKEDQSFSMGYLIYENKTAFISSAKEAFGFIVESKEFSDLMKMQFEAIFASVKIEKNP